MDYREVDLEGRLAIAQAQDTSLETLQQLVTDKAEAVRRAIALNPNADEALLQSLGKAFPEEVIQNPVFALLLLENPESSFVLLSQARSVTASPELLERCAQSNEEELLIAVGGNPKTPLLVLEQLVNEPPVLSGYDYAEPDDYHRIFTAIAENPSTPTQLLQKIVEQWGVAKYAVARNSKAPVELLWQFSAWRNRNMLIAIAQNPATPTAIIEKLVIEEYEAVRQTARSHPNTPSNLEELTNFVEQQPGASPELLGKLAADKREYVRCLVASHPETPIATLEVLAQDDKPKVAEQARYNPNASETVLINYAKFLIKQATIVSPTNKEMYECKAVDLIQDPKITEQALEVLTLFGGGSVTINQAIAKSKAASAELLLKLSQQSQDIHFWGDLVKNPATPGDALKHLFRCLSNAKHFNAMGFLSILAAHPNVPQDLWPEILQDPRLLESAASNPNLPLDAIQELLKAEDWRIIGNIARNPSTPLEILQQLMVKDARIRCRLAQNINLPIALLEILAKDEDQSVIFGISYNANATAELLEVVANQALIPQQDADARLEEIQIRCMLNLAAHDRSNRGN